MRTRFLMWVLLPALLLAALPVSAQSLWTTVDMEKSLIDKKLAAFAEMEYRTHQALMSERVSASLGLEYTLVKGLKMQASYSYIYRQTQDEFTRKGNLVPAYWSPRHRANLALTASYKLNKRWKFSLREAYQYTYRYQMFVPKYSPDGSLRLADEEVSAKHKHVLKSRLQASYDIKKSPFEPYVSAEPYLDLATGTLDKTRFTLGSEYKINKQHSLEGFVRYILHSDEDEAAGWVLGLGYKIDF